MDIKNFISEEDYSKLVQIQKENNFIKAIYIGGSAVIPWIKKPHDIDLIFVIDNDFKTADAYPILDHYRLNSNLSTICATEDFFINIYLYKPFTTYMQYFNLYVCGEHISPKMILEDDMIINRFIKYLKNVKKQYDEKGCFQKNIYNIITTLFLIDNKKYELTEEQIDIINRLHDDYTSSEAAEIFNRYYLRYWGASENGGV